MLFPCPVLSPVHNEMAAIQGRHFIAQRQAALAGVYQRRILMMCAMVLCGLSST